MIEMNKDSVLQESEYYKLIIKTNAREKSRPKKLDEATKQKRIKQWCTFYRRNINIYISERLRVKLKPFQHIQSYLMGRSDFFWNICSRGTSKSFLTMLVCTAIALLYPFSEIVIVSSTIDQANKLVDNKLEKELIGKLSPVLKWMYDNGYIKISHPKDCAQVDFGNGSWIRVMPALDSSRGERATVLVAEEARLIKKSIWDSVFTKMAHPRQAEFMQLKQYETMDELKEQCKEFYLTSAWFKSHWIWNSFKNCVSNCFNDKSAEWNFYAADIFVAIRHGFKTKVDLSKAKQEGELEFRIEDLNEMVGEADNAYFTLEMFQKNQVLTQAFRPPTNEEVIAGTIPKMRKKGDNEYRILAVDLAFSENAAGKERESDRCALEIMSVICKPAGGVERRLEYVESMGGGDDKAVKQRIRELFWDCECDKICIDMQGGGGLYYSDLSSPWEHPMRRDWNPHGFGICEEPNMQFITEGTLNELRARTVDPEAIPCMIPMKATAELNSNMWKSLWKVLNNGELLLLEDELQATKRYDENYKTELLSSQERFLALNPFIQTSMLISEGINLSQSWKNGVLTLTQPRMGHKDRCSALQYANAVADKIENNYAISQHSDEFNISDFYGCLI